MSNAEKPKNDWITFRTINVLEKRLVPKSSFQERAITTIPTTGYNLSRKKVNGGVASLSADDD